jgi:hypothetical protein
VGSLCTTAVIVDLSSLDSLDDCGSGVLVGCSLGRCSLLDGGFLRDFGGSSMLQLPRGLSLIAWLWRVSGMVWTWLVARVVGD